VIPGIVFGSGTGSRREVDGEHIYEVVGHVKLAKGIVLGLLGPPIRAEDQ